MPKEYPPTSEVTNKSYTSLEQTPRPDYHKDCQEALHRFRTSQGDERKLAMEEIKSLKSELERHQNPGAFYNNIDGKPNFAITPKLPEKPKLTREQIKAKILDDRENGSSYSLAGNEIIDSSTNLPETPKPTTESQKPDQTKPENNNTKSGEAESATEKSTRLNIFKGEQILNGLLKSKIEEIKKEKIGGKLEELSLEDAKYYHKQIREVLISGQFIHRNINELSDEIWKSYLKDTRKILEERLDADKYIIYDMIQTLEKRRSGMN